MGAKEDMGSAYEAGQLSSMLLKGFTGGEGSSLFSSKSAAKFSRDKATPSNTAKDEEEVKMILKEAEVKHREWERGKGKKRVARKGKKGEVAAGKIVVARAEAARKKGNKLATAAAADDDDAEEEEEEDDDDVHDQGEEGGEEDGDEGLVGPVSDDDDVDDPYSEPDTSDAGEGDDSDEEVKRYGAEEELEELQAQKKSSERASRTLFVGNVPASMSTKQIKMLFKKHGQVESVRLRSVAVKPTAVGDHGNQKLMRKVCVNQGKLDLETKDSMNAYVVFKQESSAEAALALGGHEVLGHHLRVDRSTASEHDASRSVFIGNLHFAATEEMVREHFVAGLPNGEAKVESVRLIRDAETQMGKGFGYVLLRDRPSVTEALRLHGKKLAGRELRVMVCGKRTKRGEPGQKAGFEGRRATGAERRVLGKQKRKGNKRK
ncbi:unnamed protein product, partial [Chrysoparadoxa australica]